MGMSLNVDRNRFLEIGSDDSKMFAFLCTWSIFDHLAKLSATQSLKFEDTLAGA